MSACTMAGSLIIDLARRLREAKSSAEIDAIAGDAAGSPEAEAVVALARDVAAANERVAATNRAREVLLASVAHDLRNPLNTFAMSAGLLRDDLDGGDIDATRALSLVARMDRALGRMQGLIEDLLEASRIDAGKVDFALRSENASQIVLDAVKAASAAVGERAPAVTVDELDENAKVNCDRARTIQTLAKMVAYATKATGEGGSIRLGCRADGAATLFFARAFSPSGQPVAPPEEGRGGLALLMGRGLAEAQRGTFRVEPGTALVLTLTLPAG